MQFFDLPVLQHGKVHFTINHSFFKEEGWSIHTFLWHSTEHIYLKGISHMLKTDIRVLSFPYACVMLVNFAIYVEGHLIVKNKSNLSSSNLSNISVQNSWQIGLSVSFNCWINCSLYSVDWSHLFKTCQTVADGNCSSQLAILNDLCELHWKACQTCSTISTEVERRPVLFAKHKHPLLFKFCMPIQNGMSIWRLLGKRCTKFVLNMCPWVSFSIF